jgi:hypothetical protein
MTEAFATSRPQATSGGFHVSAPCPGDMLSGALHRVYDDRRNMPADLLALLAELDRVERSG